MDDIHTGPQDFDLYFISSSPNVFKTSNGSFTFVLNKTLEFANEWEIGIKQLIIKSPLLIPAAKISYTEQDNSTGDTITKLLSLENYIPDNPRDLINKINESIPQSVKENVSFSIDDDNVASVNVKKTKVTFQSAYLTEILGFDEKQTYPRDVSTDGQSIKASKQIKLSNNIFTITVDITVPGGETILMDVFQNSKDYVNYKYDTTSYYKILRSFVSSITLELKDINTNFYTIDDIFIVKFHFRKSSVI